MGESSLRVILRGRILPHANTFVFLQLIIKPTLAAASSSVFCICQGYLFLNLKLLEFSLFCPKKSISIWSLASLEAASILLDMTECLENLDEAEVLDCTELADLDFSDFLFRAWSLSFNFILHSVYSWSRMSNH